jgi:hypothetical protein
VPGDLVAPYARPAPSFSTSIGCHPHGSSTCL